MIYVDSSGARLRVPRESGVFSSVMTCCWPGNPELVSDCLSPYWCFEPRQPHRVIPGLLSEFACPWLKDSVTVWVVCTWQADCIFVKSVTLPLFGWFINKIWTLLLCMLLSNRISKLAHYNTHCSYRSCVPLLASSVSCSCERDGEKGAGGVDQREGGSGWWGGGDMIICLPQGHKVPDEFSSTHSFTCNRSPFNSLLSCSTSDNTLLSLKGYFLWNIPSL